MFEKASIDESSAAHDEADISKYVFERSVEYDQKRNNDLLEQLVEALLPCGADDGSRPVNLRVEGYASSEPFVRESDGVPYVYSEDLNVRTANERQAAVESALAALIGDRVDLIRIAERAPWESIESMESARQFNDRPLGVSTGAIPQDLLTRSAHIKITDAGLCSVDSGLRRPRAR